MNNLKALRTQKGIYQKDIASFLNVAVSTYSYWEQGKFEPDGETLKKLADYFNVSVDYLLGRETHTTIDTTQRAAKIKDLAIKDEVEMNDFYPIPLLGSVVAGVPIEAQEDLEGYVYISFHPKEEYFNCA